jgi:predicted DNA-binding protein
MQNIPDYSGIKFSMADMERFFKDGNVQLSDQTKQKLNTIFEKCDKRGEDGKKLKGGDGVLTGKERESFMKKIKHKMPEIYENVVDFFVAVDVIEELDQADAVQKKSLQQVQKEHEQNAKDLRMLQNRKKIEKWLKTTSQSLQEIQEQELEKLKKLEQEYQQEKVQREIKFELDKEQERK